MQIISDLDPNELIIDFFAGGGGASEGMEQALGRPVDYAVNHDREALALHAANHPDTKHLCEDVFTVDIDKMVGGRPVGLAWFSPDCTFHSKARGSKPMRDADRKVRGLAWVVLKFAGKCKSKPRVICLENVEEFQFWGMVHREPRNRRDRQRCKVCKQVFDGRPCPKHKGVTFKRWKTQLTNLGYRAEHRELRGSRYGAGTIRKRLFVIARNDGQPIVWPEPTHGPEPGLLPYVTAADCIDWSIPCPSIFLTKKEAKGQGLDVIRPLAPNSMARIAKGVKRYVMGKRRPFLVKLTHQGGERTGDICDPISTITGAHRGEQAVVDAKIAPFIGTYYGSNRPGGDRTAPANESLRTQSTENRFALVSTFLTRQFGASVGSSSTDPTGTITPGGGGKTGVVAATIMHATHQNNSSSPEFPLNTIMTGKHHGIIETALAPFIAQHNSQRGGDGLNPGRSAMEPISTLTTTAAQTQIVASHIMKMYGTNIGSPMNEPLHTVPAGGLKHAEVRVFLKKHFGEDVEPIVWIDGEPWIIIDIGMRMLTARELFRCQGFPDSYIIEGGRDVCNPQGTLMIGAEWIELTKTAQIRMCGNSVCPPAARAIVRAQFNAQPAEQRVAA